MKQAELQAFFEDLHRHPELSFHEVRTTACVRAALEAADIAILASALPTGLVAEIRGSRPGPVIALRADMDALPVTEASGLPYASVHPGVMHACGHDFHTTALLGTALRLQQMRDSLAGTVKLIFQPGEEASAGAASVIATGLLADAQAFLALHTCPELPAGTLGIRTGPVMAACDRFAVRLRGRGAHGAEPHKSADPIPAMAALIQGLQTLISRRLDPFRPAVLSVTHAEAGRTWNIIPQEAFIEGTFRTLEPADRTLLREGLCAMAEQTAAAYGCTAQVELENGSPAVINDETLTALAQSLAAPCGFKAVRQPDAMIAEDFSEYLTEKPGFFLRVGTGGSHPLHHPGFTADASVLAQTADYMTALAAALLQRLQCP